MERGKTPWLFSVEWIRTIRRPIVEMAVSWVEMGGVWGGVDPAITLLRTGDELPIHL
jgi:hypothetical protein